MQNHIKKSFNNLFSVFILLLLLLAVPYAEAEEEIRYWKINETHFADPNSACEYLVGLDPGNDLVSRWYVR